MRSRILDDGHQKCLEGIMKLPGHISVEEVERVCKEHIRGDSGKIKDYCRKLARGRIDFCESGFKRLS